MCNLTLTNFIYFFFLILFIESQTQNIQESSQCIGNCMFCDPKKPTACLDDTYNLIGEKVCLPFYKGTNCEEQTYGYENIFKENGTFSNWSLNKTSNCQLVSKNDKGVLVSIENMTYNGLGSFNVGDTLNKTINFASGTVTNRAVIKFSVAVDDPNLESYFPQQSQSSSTNQSTTSTPSSTTTASNSTQTLNMATETRNETLPNGTILTYTITYYDPTKLTSTNATTTTTSQTSSVSSASSQGGKQWMFVELIDLDSNQVVEKKSLSLSAASSTRGTCGFIYSYELSFNLNKTYSQIILRFSVDTSLNLTWTLLNFDLNLGCRSFLVSSGNSSSYNCGSCLSGFYPKLAINKQVSECKACDFRCKSCTNSTTCLTCIENTALNEKTGMCEFSEYFKTLGNYQIITGKAADVKNSLGSQIVRSQGGKLELSETLSNIQPFRVSFLLLYSQAFKDSAQNLDILINGQKFRLNSSDLPLDVFSSIVGFSNESINIYQTRLTYDITSVIPKNTSSSSNASILSYPLLGATKQKASIALQNSAVNDDFGVAAVNVVQFQCSKNCESCIYSQYTQTSECTKCSYFFDLSTNCLTCANGYYPATINSIDQCVKCYSTCKQCSGPEISDCLTCFDNFQLGEMIYDYQCITCIYKSQFYNTSSISECINSPECLSNHPPSKVVINKNCSQCLNSGEDELTTSDVCISCWLDQKLAKSLCEPIPERGYQLYGSDVSEGIISSQWTSNFELIRKNLTSEYTDLYGVDWQSSGNQTTMMNFTEPFLPSHRGFTIFLTFFKVNTWSNTSNDKINIVIKSQDKYIVINNTINVNPSHGYNIYGDEFSGPEMMYNFVGNSPEHSNTGKFELLITSTHTGIFVRDMEVYLGNCNECDGNKLTYEIYYIPSYSTNDTQTGLDVWLTFNQGVNFVSNDPDTQSKVVNSFQFSIDQLGYQNLIPFIIKDNQINTWNYVKYFLPIDETLINATLRVNNSMGNNIYSKVSKTQAFLSNPLVSSSRKNLNIESLETNQDDAASNSNSHSPRLLLNERLESINIEESIHRYEFLSTDERTSMSQMESFYEFFQWFTLFTMIVFAFFGIGIIFEEFSILVQLLFLHIYVTTNLLPATFKLPLAQMEKMENLNFFAYPHAKSIEQTWFGSIQQCSPYPFTQYGIDVYFARSFYAIIIINLIYLFWFVVLLLCYKFLRPFRTSPNKLIKFFRDIPQRPLNYMDQIWRYQFITTVWASFLQFFNFDGNTGAMRLNLALCIFSFIISILWPIFVMIYTYRQHLVINVEHFMYLYNDIYYRKISSLAEKASYYMYIAVRFGRYFFYALFIAVFIFRSTIGPVILLAVTFLEIIYVLKFKVYRDKLYLLLKIIENIGFMILEILLLIVYGFADDTLTKEGYINIGYGINCLYIAMIINGLARVFYLCYKKAKEIWNGRYDYGDKGDLQNYDNKSPITMELPTTERGLF